MFTAPGMAVPTIAFPNCCHAPRHFLSSPVVPCRGGTHASPLDCWCRARSTAVRETVGSNPSTPTEARQRKRACHTASHVMGAPDPGGSGTADAAVPTRVPPQGFATVAMAAPQRACASLPVSQPS
jgi:hypothetical protein